MQIDAHQHFWRVSRGDYGWLTPDAHPAICRDFGPDDLRPLLAAAEVERTVLVQAAPTAAETDFLLTIATATTFVAGVVGWADFEARDAPARIEALASDPKLLGLRPMLQDLPDVAWIGRPSIGAALDTMERLGLTFDALVTPRHLSHIARLIESRPGLRLVIDHGAKPDIAAGELGGWAEQMLAIGRGSEAFCKLSGLVTQAQADWRAEDLKPYVDVLLDAFGPARLMWGSDWPVVNEAGGYAAWRAAAEALTAHLSAGERALIFGGTAAAFYGIVAWD
ncbi:MAG TPA: amidohydrolase family protein [Caulobacteraceae bacterium]|nr:amidohydrolase family protein [Caulobacteraceae bacterium]